MWMSALPKRRKTRPDCVHNIFSENFYFQNVCRMLFHILHPARAYHDRIKESLDGRVIKNERCSEDLLCFIWYLCTYWMEPGLSSVNATLFMNMKRSFISSNMLVKYRNSKWSRSVNVSQADVIKSNLFKFPAFYTISAILFAFVISRLIFLLIKHLPCSFPWLHSITELFFHRNNIFNFTFPLKPSCFVWNLMR